MDCCENKNITCKDCENICINCSVIHGYKYVNETSFRDYNMNLSNILFYKKTIYKRKKYLYNKSFPIREINNNIILFFDNSLEEIRKLYNMRRISISKYLNSINYFYCNKSSINYKPILKNKKIINLNDDIIEILEKNYLEYPHYIKIKMIIIIFKKWYLILEYF